MISSIRCIRERNPKVIRKKLLIDPDEAILRKKKQSRRKSEIGIIVFYIGSTI